MSSKSGLGRINRAARPRRRLAPVRLLLPLGWLLAAAGYFGPWIAHNTAGLTITGVDTGEFVKFLPPVLEGTLPVIRQLLYLPPFAVVVSIALLVGSQRLAFPWIVRLPALLLALPVSLQLLPPAWSPASLPTAEFRLQTIALGVLWLMLAGFWLWRYLPSWLTGSLTAALALVAATLSSWQFLLAKPAIAEVYNQTLRIGWGWVLCMAGLLALVVAGVLLVWRSRIRSGDR